MTINADFPIEKPHIPVLLAEVIENLKNQQASLIIDATFGAGGYSRAILEAHDGNKVIACDRDENVRPFAEILLSEFPSRFKFIHSKFSDLKNHLPTDVNIDAVVFDLGISSMQIDQKERGFSFSKEADLNMQMGLNEISAYEVVNEFSEEELANLIYKYGEEKESRKIAKAIIEQRQISDIISTLQLANIISSAKARHGKIHPATQTFQAIRIFVNQELEELENGLLIAKDLVRFKGKILVVSFQGLEDVIIKTNFRAKANPNRYLPSNEEDISELKFKSLTKKPIKPTFAEIKANPRSRSAKLRIFEKL